MMADTLLLATLISGLLIFLLFIVIKGSKLSRKKVYLTILISLFAIVSLFLYTGTGKIKSDISRIIHNSSPKSPIEIYTLLFKKPLDNCVTVINLKDQEIPTMDCCIWMELKLCPKELGRIINSKKYRQSVYGKSDSLIYLSVFRDKPIWWNPAVLSGSVIKLTITFDKDNEQTLFFGKDSSHVYLCDQAL